MNEKLVYKHEGTLAALTLVISIILWVALIAGTVGIALAYLLFAFIGYLFVHSAFISYVKGTGVKLTAEQFPDLHQRYLRCCQTLGIQDPPEVYLLHGDGLFNAFATRFLGRNFVILLSDLVDAFERQPESLDFYIGHELGHIRRKHLTGAVWRWPASVLPILGAAYSRAREYTCDLHGLACCPQPEHAARAVAAIGAGSQRWSHVNLRELARQSKETGGFWMSFHEITGDYPWLVKRLARVMARDSVKFPRRHPLAWLLALFVPRVGGRAGGAAGVLVTIAIIGILAAIAIPAYSDYQQRAKLSGVHMFGQTVAGQVGAYYAQHRAAPQTLAEAGVQPGPLPAGVSRLDYQPEGAVVVLELDDERRLLLTPSASGQEGGALRWSCSADGIPLKQLPMACRGDAPRD